MDRLRKKWGLLRGGVGLGGGGVGVLRVGGASAVAGGVGLECERCRYMARLSATVANEPQQDGAFLWGHREVRALLETMEDRQILQARNRTQVGVL